MCFNPGAIISKTTCGVATSSINCINNATTSSRTSLCESDSFSRRFGTKIATCAPIDSGCRFTICDTISKAAVHSCQRGTVDHWSQEGGKEGRKKEIIRRSV